MNPKKRIVAALAVVTIAAGIVLAQNPAPAPEGKGPRGKHNRMERIANYLELTPAQREQAKAIWQQARQESKPYVDQLREARKALAQAIKANQPESELQRLGEAQGVAMGKLAGIRAKAAADVYALLTPEQKQKADKLHEKFMSRMKGRHARS